MAKGYGQASGRIYATPREKVAETAVVPPVREKTAADYYRMLSGRDEVPVTMEKQASVHRDDRSFLSRIAARAYVDESIKVAADIGAFNPSGTQPHHVLPGMKVPEFGGTSIKGLPGAADMQGSIGKQLASGTVKPTGLIDRAGWGLMGSKAKQQHLVNVAHAPNQTMFKHMVEKLSPHMSQAQITHAINSGKTPDQVARNLMRLSQSIPDASVRASFAPKELQKVWNTGGKSAIGGLSHGMKGRAGLAGGAALAALYLAGGKSAPPPRPIQQYYRR